MSDGQRPKASLRRAACGLFLSVLLGACSTTPTEPQIVSNTVRNGKGVPNGRSDSADPAAKLNEVSSDPTYGYTAANPIKVGSVAKGGSLNEGLYLNALRGPAGKPIEYERLGACCAFDTPNGRAGGVGVLDVFQVKGEGVDATKRLYINMYDPGPAMAPMGFSLRAAQRDVGKLKSLLPAGATPEQQAQIDKAFRAAPLLVEHMNEAVANGSLARIEVVRSEVVQLAGKPSPFRAGISGSDLRITEGLLKDLQLGCTLKSAKPGDLCPDNTVFVLGHLTYHARNAKAMAEFDAQRRRTLESTRAAQGAGKTVDVNAIVKEAVDKRLKLEASGFITGWNCVVDEATARNGGPLAEAQIASLLANLRYRFALIKALNAPADALTISSTGSVEMNARNIGAVRAALMTSSMADIE